MKHLLRTILLVSLCLGLILGAIPAGAAGQSGTCGERTSWTIDASGLVTISGRGAMYDYSTASVPWDKSAVTAVSISQGVTTVGSYAFWNCPQLQSVTLPEGLTAIGEKAFAACTALSIITLPSTVTLLGKEAFQGCTGLTAARLPDGLTRIESYAFQKCSALKDLTLGSGLREIGYAAFQSCSSLPRVTLPEGLYRMEDYAFWGCSALTSIAFPASLSDLGDWAFYKCSSLREIPVAADNPTFTGRGGLVYTRDLTDLVVCPLGIRGSVVLPRGLTAVSFAAFEGCAGLTEVTIPATVTTVSDYAFAECDNLAKVWYEGSPEQWNSLSIGRDNDWLTEASLTCNDHPDYDSNGDGQKDLKDISLLFRACLGEVTLPLRTADINRDGCLSLKDVHTAYLEIYG